MRSFLVILALLVSFPAFANETLAVRAGEHGDYSRLVIPNPPEGWRIATSDRKVEIQFPATDAEFDLSDILERRKAHRVLSARVVDAGASRSLVLSLTCDCPVRTARSVQNSIVIDIFAETPVALSPEEEGVSNELSAAARNTISSQENVSAARDRMIALLAAASDQGVVQLKGGETTTEATDTPKAHGEDAPGDSAHPVTPAAHAPADDHHDAATDAHAETAADHAPQSLLPVAEAADAAAGLAAGDDCPDPTLFREPEHDAEKLDYAAISRLRQRFDESKDEDERLNLAATLALAYMQIGFFEEAAAIAGPRGRAGDPNMAAAGALADIAAGANARAANALAPFRKCSPLFELAYAAASASEDPEAAPMRQKHVDELAALTEVLRGPLGENLGLHALETDDLKLANKFYIIARDARGGEKTSALAILESELAGFVDHEQIADAGESHGGAHGDAHAVSEGHGHEILAQPAPVVTEEIKELAQTPGPLQARALAILARDYEVKADEAYVGLLDDIAAQSGRKARTLAEARASFAGARSLATAGRLGEGVGLLQSSAESAPASKDAGQALARALILQSLGGDEKARVDAASTFFRYRDFVVAPDNGDLNIAVARELADLGAPELVEDAVRGVPAAWRADADVARALALLNAGEPQSVIDLAASGAPSKELRLLAVRAHERLDDRAGAVAAIRTALKTGAADNELANAAWRASEWKLAADALDAVPSKERSHAAAARVALGALNTGAKQMPKAAAEALDDDPQSRDAIAHMFVAAPVVNARALGLISDFAQGVVRETNFMGAGLGARGDGDE